VLTEDQRLELDTTGIVRLPGVLSEERAAEMAEAIWASLAQRGIDRADRKTWPEGFVGGHQKLKTSRVFSDFETARTSELVDSLLAPGEWEPNRPWGPLLVTFPQREPWSVPRRDWHLDVRPGGDPDRQEVVRLFGFIAAVCPRGGGTMVVEGSHKLVRRLVASSSVTGDGSSVEIRKTLAAMHPWFRALWRRDGDRDRQLMIDGEEIDGVHVKVTELTGHAGDLFVMQPWTLHCMSINSLGTPRLAVTHTVNRLGPG
jgi:hypothetical protein